MPVWRKHTTGRFHQSNSQIVYYCRLISFHRFYRIPLSLLLLSLRYWFYPIPHECSHNVRYNEKHTISRARQSQIDFCVKWHYVWVLQKFISSSRLPALWVSTLVLRSRNLWWSRWLSEAGKKGKEEVAYLGSHLLQTPRAEVVKFTLFYLLPWRFLTDNIVGEKPASDRKSVTVSMYFTTSHPK